MDLQEIFQRLWTDYTTQNPSTDRIYRLFTNRGEEVVNDHIAFRTFDDPRLNTDVLARPFEQRGYRAMGEYRFEAKHLRARHYEIPGQKRSPRIFVSELILDACSASLQQTIREAIDQVEPEILRSEDLIFSGSIFGTVSYETYQQLRKESEYAAWLYVHGFRVNHFTVSVNSLKGFSGIREVNQYLKDQGFPLNQSGGEIKGSEAQLLKQSSTMAEIITLPFREGEFDIPACYYEFAERFKGPDGKLFSGFITGSADKIFESTDYRKKPSS